MTSAEQPTLPWSSFIHLPNLVDNNNNNIENKSIKSINYNYIYIVLLNYHIIKF